MYTVHKFQETNRSNCDVVVVQTQEKKVCVQWETSTWYKSNIKGGLAVLCSFQFLAATWYPKQENTAKTKGHNSEFPQGCLSLTFTSVSSGYHQITRTPTVHTFCSTLSTDSIYKSLNRPPCTLFRPRHLDTLTYKPR